MLEILIPCCSLSGRGDLCKSTSHALRVVGIEDGSKGKAAVSGVHQRQNRENTDEKADTRQARLDGPYGFLLHYHPDEIRREAGNDEVRSKRCV